MNIQDYYCEVDQDQANEAKELLIKAGEAIWEYMHAFSVKKTYIVLKYGSKDCQWFVGMLPSGIKTTYPKFRKMLLDKIEGDGKN